MVITSSAADLPTPSSFPPYTSTNFYKSLQASYIISRLDMIFSDSKNQVSSSQLKPSNTLPTIKVKSTNLGLGVRKDVRIYKNKTKKRRSVYKATGFVLEYNTKGKSINSKPHILPIQSRTHAYSSNGSTPQQNFAATSVRAAPVTLFQYSFVNSFNPSTKEPACQHEKGLYFSRDEQNQHGYFSKSIISPLDITDMIVLPFEDVEAEMGNRKASVTAIMPKLSASMMKLHDTVQGCKIVIFVDIKSTHRSLSEVLFSYMIFLSRLHKPPDTLESCCLWIALRTRRFSKGE